MQVRYEDCRCEDYPCCGHFDTLYGDEQQGNYCDYCGIYHSVTFDCLDYDDDSDDYDDDEDAASIRGVVNRLHVNASADRDAEADYDYMTRGPFDD